MMPSESEIARVQRETGMERMQVINHIRSRQAAIEALAARRRAAAWPVEFSFAAVAAAMAAGSAEFAKFHIGDDGKRFDGVFITDSSGAALRFAEG